MCGDSEVKEERKPAAMPRGRRRRKIWELERSFHCSLIGTCLSLDELRMLCRKLQPVATARLSDYELHRSFVAVAAEDSYAARRLHKFLDRKYRHEIRCLNAVPAEELQAHWRASLASRDPAGVYWALATDAGAPAALVERAYGEIHMLSHLAGAAARVDKDESQRLRRKAEALRKQQLAAQARARARDSQREQLLRRTQERLARARAQLQQHAEGRRRSATTDDLSVISGLRAQVEDYAARLADARLRAETAAADARQWKQMAVKQGDRLLRMEQCLIEARTERDALEHVMEKRVTATEQVGAVARDEASGVNLCGRCILYVGGRDRQCARFRELVECNNGRFLHHDGGLHEGRLRLGSLLPRADAVLCPLDCVSHDASRRVREFCKRHGKKLILLPRASLAAFARGLSELTA